MTSSFPADDVRGLTDVVAARGFLACWEIVFFFFVPLATLPSVLVLDNIWLVLHDWPF